MTIKWKYEHTNPIKSHKTKIIAIQKLQHKAFQQQQQQPQDTQEILKDTLANLVSVWSGYG